MKKQLFFRFICILLIINLFSCASSKKVSENSESTEKAETIVTEGLSEVSEVTETETQEQEENVSKNGKKGKKRLSLKEKQALKKREKIEAKKAKEEEKLKKKEAAREARKSFVIYENGNVYLKVNKKLGTFNISGIDTDGKKIPFLVTTEEAVSNSIFLKSGHSIYKLSAGAGIKTSTEKLSDGIRILYSIPGIADVYADLHCIQSTPESTVDMVKIELSAVNSTLHPKEMGLKIVLDTLLGEKTHSHFYDQNKKMIKNEVLFREFENNRFVTTKNISNQLQIIFDGGDITKPEFAALANYATLSSRSWEPDMLQVRTFDTVTSYNNSGVVIAWPIHRILENEDFTEVFYVAVSCNEEEAKAAQWLKIQDELKAKAEENAKENEDSPKIIEEESDDGIYLEVSFSEEQNKPSTKKTEFVAETKKSEKKPKSEDITEKQLEPEYIQALLDRIAELEESDSTLNRNELLDLNAELDAILEKLKQ